MLLLFISINYFMQYFLFQFGQINFDFNGALYLVYKLLHTSSLNFSFNFFFI